MMILSFIHFFFLVSFQALQKIHLASYIQSLVELLHADAMQQLEVALLGTPAAKMLEVLSWATSSHKACTSISSRTSLTPASTSLTIVAPPQVPRAGVIPGSNSEKLLAIEEVRASTSSNPKGTLPSGTKLHPCHCQPRVAMFPNYHLSLCPSLRFQHMLFLSRSTVQGATNIINAKYVCSSIQTEIAC